MTNKEMNCLSVEENMKLMKTLDDAWNSQDWDTFNERHNEEVTVYWPGQPEPTEGSRAHHLEAVEFFKTFPDNHVGNMIHTKYFLVKMTGHVLLQYLLVL